MLKHDPNSGTLHNVWVPLVVVHDALPLFVKAQDKIVNDEVSIHFVYVGLSDIICYHLDNCAHQFLPLSPCYVDGAEVIVFNLSDHRGLCRGLGH